MKNLILLVLVVAGLMYFGRSCTPQTEEKTASRHADAPGSRAGGPVREWEQAPNAVMDMQGAMGGAGAGPANAVRDTVRDQVSR
jgi:hypothetical protein